MEGYEGGRQSNYRPSDCDRDPDDPDSGARGGRSSDERETRTTEGRALDETEDRGMNGKS